MTLTDTLELSQSNEMRLPLLWTAILAGRVKASLAGADVVMTTSALLVHDAGYMSTLTSDIHG
jgi:dihydroorotate dehydrogenase (fumarate)